MPLDSLPEELTGAELPAVLLPYQQQLLATTAVSQFVVCEKSRRIGMTWAVAADAVLTAGAQRSAGGMDALYIGFNLDMAREFIDTAAMWAREFMPAATDVSEFLFIDQDEDGHTKEIQAFRIRFASGFEIVALSSKPRSLRGRQGYVIFDEAAFHDELDEMLKAATALLMWGGKVLVISTHDGVDNPFNQLVQDVRAGKRGDKATVVRVTLDEAMADGLYERIALITGKEPTEEAKLAWRQEIVDFYADGADEELFCIPRAGSGAYITGASVDACMNDDHVVARLTCPDGFELRTKEARHAFVEEFLDENVRPVLRRLDPERRTALGEDFGRTMDLTVLAIGQEQQDMSVTVPLMIELKNCPIEQQFHVIKAVIHEIARFVGAKVDATGNGLGLAERCQEEFGFEMIEAVKLSQGYYLEHGPAVRQAFQDQSIELPKDSDIKDDMRAVKLVRGIPTIPEARKKGRHGDSFVALMLLLAALDSDYQEAAYRPVKQQDADRDRRLSTTAGFGAITGVP